jgi:hypothetical protein
MSFCCLLPECLFSLSLEGYLQFRHARLVQVAHGTAEWSSVFCLLSSRKNPGLRESATCISTLEGSIHLAYMRNEYRL